MKKNVMVLILLLSSAFFVNTQVGTAQKRPIQRVLETPPMYDISPAKTQELTVFEDSMPQEVIPWNVDMVDVEATSSDGEGVYVAVLDTGLLSNYLDFFPEGLVDIKEEWGIGFTHNVFYVGAGGNWTEDGKFSHGPLRDDRGFITYDLLNPLWAYNTTSGEDEPFPYGSGHGTHVTSILTGYHFYRGPIEAWIAGVSPKVTIIPVLVLDIWIVFEPDGQAHMWTGGTDEMVAAGIKYVGELAEEHGLRIIINMSLGGPEPSTEIEEAIDYAISRGVIVVAAAGNAGEEGMDWPGAYPQVISTAAAGWTQEYGGGYYDYYWWWEDVPEKLNENNVVYDPVNDCTYKNNWHTYLTDFSSRPNRTLGQRWQDLDVSTPGAAVRGPYKPYGPTQWGYYAVWGTSQAAPHASGISALLLQPCQDIDQYEMETILKHAARRAPMPSDGAYVSDTFSNFAVWYYYWNGNDYGSGFLTVDEAMKSVEKLLK